MNPYQKDLQKDLDRAKHDLRNYVNNCKDNHVAPLLQLMGLPIGSVISKEYNPQADTEFWEVTVAGETYRGPDIVRLLKSIKL